MDFSVSVYWTKYVLNLLPSWEGSGVLDQVCPQSSPLLGGVGGGFSSGRNLPPATHPHSHPQADGDIRPTSNA